MAFEFFKHSSRILLPSVLMTEFQPEKLTKIKQFYFIFMDFIFMLVFTSSSWNFVTGADGNKIL